MAQEELQNYYFFKSRGKILVEYSGQRLLYSHPNSEKFLKISFIAITMEGRNHMILQTVHPEEYASIFAEMGTAAQSILFQLMVVDKDSGPQKSELPLMSLTWTLYSPGSSPPQLLTQFANVFLYYFFFSARLHEGWHPDTGQLFSKHLLNESTNVEQLLTVRLRILYNQHISLDKRK